MRSEIYDIVVSRTVLVDDGNAAIVEVECDVEQAVVLQPAPLPCILVDVQVDEYAVVVKAGAQRFVTLPARQYCHVDGLLRHTVGDDGLATSSLDILGHGSGAVVDDGWLQVVCQAEAQPTQLGLQPMVARRKGSIGIVWVGLAHDVSHELIVGGRLHAKASAVPASFQPDEYLMEPIHLSA